MAQTILLIEWKSFGNCFIREAFERLGYEVKVVSLDRKNVDIKQDAGYTEQLVHILLAKTYQFVFSFNFFPIVAIACKACGVPYVSWTYDSPYVPLFSRTALYDTNRIFVFDRGLCRDLEKRGIHCKYLPMAAPMDCYEDILKRRRFGVGRFYGGDISFVGSLYDEISGRLLDYLDDLEAEAKGYVDALIQAQKRVYGYNFVEEVLSAHPERMEAIQRTCPVYASGDGLESAEWVFAHCFVNRRVTVEERKEILQMLARMYAVHLYTTSETVLSGVHKHGNVDYYEEAPFVYADSKINLNITLRSIQTGIPLRAFDIMACGGFLISNYQEDFVECFEADREYVFYSDFGDLKEKAGYYLTHDGEREKIARRGRERVAAEHTYLHRVRQMLGMIW